MRSVAITLGHDKLRGLLEDQYAPYDSPGFTQCYNLRATAYGLEAPRPLTDPGTLPSAVSWPFPQLFRTNFHTLAAYTNKLYLVNEATWTYTDITPVGIASGHMWTLVDMYGAWVLTNGSCVIWTKTPTRPETPTTSPQLAVATVPTVSCCCRCRGRAVFAGTASGVRIGIWEHLGPNFVFWTDVGGGDTYLPWSTEGFSSSDTSDFNIRSMVRQNLLGHMPMPSPGYIYRVEALDDAVMVYSSDSINALKPERLETGVHQFGLVELHKVGVKQRGLVAASKDRHYYVTGDGYLWTITRDLKPQRLGFQHLFSAPTGTWIGAFDDQNNEAYFSNGLSGYLITERGVTDLVVFPTSILPRAGFLYAPSKDSLLGTDFSLLTTTIMRLNTQANVTLAMVEAGLRGFTAPYITPHADYGSGMVTRNRTFNLNKAGVAYPRTTAPAMQFSLVGDVTGTQKVDYIRLELQYADRRFRRGIEGGET